MGISRERAIPLNGNHMEITKYGDPNDANYAIVRGNIKRMVKDITSGIGHRRQEGIMSL